ncbi:MAG: hypothetical protein ACYTDY_11885 [Planctomycetota bacterium]
MWTGYDYEFMKPDGADWTDPANQDRITDNVWLTRADERGLMNFVNETRFPPPTWRSDAPAGTEWAYGSAADWQTLEFRTWRDWARLDGADVPDTVDQDAVLHLLVEDVYLDIKFTSWTSSDNGGGFSWERATEGVAGEKVWTGPVTTFTKADDADWTDPANQDKITDDVIITRGDKRGIFNIAKEPSYFPSPPYGTAWADGSAADWQSLQFQSWYDWHDQSPRSKLDVDAVVHLMEDDVYIDIKFTSWTSDRDGGGFTLERATEGTPGEQVWTGATTTFTKADYADWNDPANQDRITENVWITRRNRRGIYNAAKETSYLPGEPSGTRWAFGRAADWKSLDFDSWMEWHGKDPRDAMGRHAVLHLVEDDIYLDIRILGWTRGEGDDDDDDDDVAQGGFIYQRAAPPITMPKLNGKLNFKKGGRDALKVKGEVMPWFDFTPDGQEFMVNVGGVMETFTLDGKGKARTASGKAKMKLNKKTQAWQFKVAMKKGNFGEAWQDEGLTNESIKGRQVTVQTVVVLGGFSFGGQIPSTYTGKSGRAGKFRNLR